MNTYNFNQTTGSQGAGFWEAESDHSTLSFHKLDTGTIKVSLKIKGGDTICWHLEPESWAAITERMKG